MWTYQVRATEKIQRKKVFSEMHPSNIVLDATVVAKFSIFHFIRSFKNDVSIGGGRQKMTLGTKGRKIVCGHDDDRGGR